MKFTIYLIITLSALGIMALNPTFIKSDAKGKLNLCNLREGQHGSVTAIIVERDDYKTTTVTNPKTGCSALVIAKDFPDELQRGITFNAIVQSGLLKIPTNIKYQDNLGKVTPYQEIKVIVRAKPRSIRNGKLFVIDLYDLDGKRIPLYISRKLVRKLKYNEFNTFQYDSNDTVQSVSQ